MYVFTRAHPYDKDALLWMTYFAYVCTPQNLLFI